METTGNTGAGLADQLQAELRRIEALVEDLTDERLGIVDSAATDVPDDEHDVEGSSIGFERARVSALLSSTRRRRDALDAVLRQLSEVGTVVCVGCHVPLQAERLLALPGVTTCVDCARGGRGGRVG